MESTGKAAVLETAKALIMSGGRSQRMRDTFGPDHKAFVPLMGVSMLERNLLRLLSCGFREIVVATNRHEPAIRHYVETRGRALCEAKGGAVRCLVEDVPLGTIGGAAFFGGGDGPVLVVNVDNLTAIDLRDFVSYHVTSDSSLSIAIHREQFRMPFGEVVLAGEEVVEYHEKPVTMHTISSGTYVLSGKICSMLEKNTRTDLPDLFRTLLAIGEKVSGFAHNAPWIDVNDAATVERAEDMIIAHGSDFEWCEGDPDAHVVSLILTSSQGNLLERHCDGSTRYKSLWDLPGIEFRPEDTTPERALDRWSFRNKYFSGSPVTFLVSFDDLDVSTKKMVRHHLFSGRIFGDFPAFNEQSTFEWFPMGESSPYPKASPVPRAIAYNRRAATSVR